MPNLSTFKKLVDDSLDIIQYVNPDIATNKLSILSAMKLDKLTTAEKRASESLALLIDLSVTPSSILEAKTQAAANIDNIGEILAYNNAAYMRIMKLVSDEIGVNSAS